jgi:sugar lactone lactonase YvrE
MGLIMLEPSCVWKAAATLGEGPVWIAEAAALYWVDILAPAVCRYTPSTGEQKRWPMPRTVGCLVPRVSGGFVAGFKDGLALLDLEGNRLEPLTDPEPDRPGNRFNDGKCDAGGRLWAGTMDDAEQDRCGALYRLDPDGTCTRMDDDYLITNGPAFSIDGSVMYHTDSMERTIYAFDVSADGAVSGKRPFISIPEDAGYPDGMTVDTADHLWVAHFGGARISRFDPEGALVSHVAMPVSNVTSCTFGGPDLDTLYVTTATKGLAPDQRGREPLAGGLFEISMDVAGLPAARFGG